MVGVDAHHPTRFFSIGAFFCRICKELILLWIETMIPLELGQIQTPRVIVEAIYAGVKREIEGNESASYLGQELANDFRRYYDTHTRLIRSPSYFLYLHAEKLETLVKEVFRRSNMGRK